MGRLSQGPRSVLFLDRANGACSLIAEALLNACGDGYSAFSAGVEPGRGVPPTVSRVLGRHGLPTSGLRPKSWREFSGRDAPPLDLVIVTSDCALARFTPVWRGNPARAIWSIPDPLRDGALPAEARRRVEATYQIIRGCVQMFRSMPGAMLERLAHERHGLDIDPVAISALAWSCPAVEPA